MKNLIAYITEALQNKQEFVIIKPEFLDKRNEIIDFLSEHQMLVMREERKTLSLEAAQQLYAPHKDKDFYTDLVLYMSGSDSIGLLLNNFGTYDMLKLKDEIRAKWGIDEMRNAIHSSDSDARRKIESKIYFAA